MQQFEVAIIGAGPIGLELAVGLKRRGVSYIQFDARQIGHTMTWWAPQTRWFSSNERIAIAGVPLVTPDGSKCTREQYLAYLRGVVQQYDLTVHTFEPVVGVDRTEDGGFVVRTECKGAEAVYGARRVVLATGGTERPRRLGIPGEDLPHVSHYFNDPHHYFGQRLMIVGGRNSAAEAALRCHHAGARVSLSYRQTSLPQKSIKYWLLPELQGLINEGRITAHFGTTPTSIDVSHVELRHDDGQIRTHAADFVLLLVGYEADMTLFRMLGVELRPGSQAPLFDEATMETTVPGVYVAGTAIAGTQERYEVYLENSHVHVARIVAHVTGARANQATPRFANPES